MTLTRQLVRVIIDKWYRTLQQCNSDDWQMIDRDDPVTTTPSPEIWKVGETEIFIDNFDDRQTFDDQWTIEVTPNPHNNELQVLRK